MNYIYFMNLHTNKKWIGFLVLVEIRAPVGNEMHAAKQQKLSSEVWRNLKCTFGFQLWQGIY